MHEVVVWIHPQPDASQLLHRGGAEFLVGPLVDVDSAVSSDIEPQQMCVGRVSVGPLVGEVDHLADEW